MTPRPDRRNHGDATLTTSRGVREQEYSAHYVLRGNSTTFGFVYVKDLILFGDARKATKPHQPSVRRMRNETKLVSELLKEFQHQRIQAPLSWRVGGTAGR